MWAFSSLLTPTFSTLSAKLLKCTSNSLSLLFTLSLFRFHCPTSHLHSPTKAIRHTHAHIHTQKGGWLLHSLPEGLTHNNIPKDTPTHKRAKTQTHTLTHTCAHTHTHAHTHTRTLTDFFSFPLDSLNAFKFSRFIIFFWSHRPKKPKSPKRCFRQKFHSCSKVTSA